MRNGYQESSSTKFAIECLKSGDNGSYFWTNTTILYPTSEIGISDISRSLFGVAAHSSFRFADLISGASMSRMPKKSTIYNN